VVAAASAPLIFEPPRFNAAYLANPPPPYPASARRRGIEGSVFIDARIGAGGEARELKLATSSGDAALDSAAMDAVRGWRFVPARRGDQAVEAWVRIPLVFRLN
jgi:protein TonB